MTTTTLPKLLTADDLLRLSGEGVRGELIRGALSETMAAGGQQAKTAAILVSLLMAFIRPRRLGTLICTDGGILVERNPDTVREPDVAFFAAGRLPLDAVVEGYYEVIPDLVAEISSPNDRPAAVHDKIQMWLRYGVALVWGVNPQTRTITAHYPDGTYTVFTENDTLDGGEVLPGFACPVRDIFEL